MLGQVQPEAFLERRLVAGGQVVNDAVFVRPRERPIGQLQGPPAKVRDPTGRAQQRGVFDELLALDPLLGDVHYHARPADRVSLRIQIHLTARMHPAHLSIGPTDAVFRLEQRPGDRHAGTRVIVGKHVFRQNETVELGKRAFELGGRDPEQIAGRIRPVQPASAEVEAPTAHAPDALRVRDQHGLLMQSVLGLLALRDVVEDGEEMRLSLIVDRFGS